MGHIGRASSDVVQERDGRSRQAAPADGTTQKIDVTATKLMAGAGAAATTAVLGSFFGATGTVAGAAIGSVASAVATSVYEHSLNRTREHVAARIRPLRQQASDRASAAEVTMPMPRPPLLDGSADPPAGRPGTGHVPEAVPGAPAGPVALRKRAVGPVDGADRCGLRVGPAAGDRARAGQGLDPTSSTSTPTSTPSTSTKKSNDEADESSDDESNSEIETTTAPSMPRLPGDRPQPAEPPDNQ